MAFRIAVLAGDGIGPEIIAEGVRALQTLDRKLGLELVFEHALVGGVAYDACGHPLPADTLALCKSCDAVLLGAVGGPKWDRIEPAFLRPEVGALLPLRKELGLFANLRPIILPPELAGASSLKPELLEGGLDLLVVRELTGGLYFGQPRGRSEDGERAFDTCVYTRAEIERIAIVGFESASARKKLLCSVDKANVLETSRLWRETVTQVAARYPDVTLTHMLVDNCAMQLVRFPGQFDVIVTENMFGDIISDEASMLTGSLGMLPSASLGEQKNTRSSMFGLYEPIHGSAPDIAGQNIANPLATLLTCALMLRYSYGSETAAAALEAAVAKALKQGFRTSDIARSGEGVIGTREMGAQVVASLEHL